MEVHIPTLADATPGIEKREVAPVTPASSGAARPLRRRCRNRKTANDMRNWQRAHPSGVVVHMDPDFTYALPSRPPASPVRGRATVARAALAPHRGQPPNHGSGPEDPKAPARRSKGPDPVRAPEERSRAESPVWRGCPCLAKFQARRSCSPSSKEESNDGTHETKPPELRRRRMDSPPFVKGLTVVFSRQNGGLDFGSGVRASAQRRMRRCAQTDRMAEPAEHDHREAPPRWFGPELNSDQAARCQEAVSIPGSVQVGPCARSDTVGHASSAPVAGPRPGRRVQGKRRPRVRLHGTESGDRVRRGSAS